MDSAYGAAENKSISTESMLWWDYGRGYGAGEGGSAEAGCWNPG